VNPTSLLNRSILFLLLYPAATWCPKSLLPFPTITTQPGRPATYRSQCQPWTITPLSLPRELPCECPLLHVPACNDWSHPTCLHHATHEAISIYSPRPSFHLGPADPMDYPNPEPVSEPNGFSKCVEFSTVAWLLLLGINTYVYPTLQRPCDSTWLYPMALHLPIKFDVQ
jgi:hypothetical protein